MSEAISRRQKVLEYLYEKKNVTLNELANKFEVSKMTIRRDIDSLSQSTPIYTTEGNGGGIHLSKDFELRYNHLSMKQAALLRKLAVTLQGDELITMQSIIASFDTPK